MINGVLLVLIFAATIGCGVAAGVFFAFSSFIMPGLRRMPAPQGIAAMQSINITAVTPAFMTLLFGTAVLCVGLVVVAIANWSQPYAGYLLAGALVYLAGAIVLTMVYNVPRNNALAALDPATPDSAAYWARYLREWTAANHVRTLSSTVATGLLIAALLRGR
jgi:uncharacterized membrane protein